MTETHNTAQSEQLWQSLSEPNRETCIYFAVSDWRTGVAKDYLGAMGIVDDNLNELVGQGVVESKPTWKMFQDEADKLQAEVQGIRDKMKDHLYRLEDSERQVLNTYDNFTRVAERKSEEPRFRLADQNFHNYINTFQGE